MWPVFSPWTSSNRTKFESILVQVETKRHSEILWDCRKIVCTHQFSQDRTLKCLYQKNLRPPLLQSTENSKVTKIPIIRERCIFSHLDLDLCGHKHLENGNANTTKWGSISTLSWAKRTRTKRLYLVKGGVCKHVVMREADARGDDRGGRCDGGDGRWWPVREQDVPLRTVQRNLLCGLYGGTDRNIYHIYGKPHRLSQKVTASQRAAAFSAFNHTDVIASKEPSHLHGCCYY